MIHTGVTAYVQQLWPQRVERQPQTTRTKLDPNPLRLSVSQLDQNTPVTVITVTGPLDRCTMATLVDRAAILYAGGVGALVIDLRATPRIELSGLFALHSIARLYRGDPLPDLEAGWAVLHEATQMVPVPCGDRVKLVALPTIARIITQSKICQLLEVYTELDDAAAAFSKNS